MSYKTTYVEYYLQRFPKGNNGSTSRIEMVVDKIIKQSFPWISEKDYDDFYSIAAQVVWDCENKYDKSKNNNFHNFLVNCLSRKIKTRITYLNREKRKADIIAESIYQKVSEDNERILEDIIEDVSETDLDDNVNAELILEKICGLLRPKEAEIITLSYSGFDNKQIASIINTDVKYVNALKDKLANNSSIRRILNKHGYLGGYEDEI